MEEKKLTCELITPMFSYGADQKIPEVRVSEIKGMMRYVYRITCPEELKTLARDEAALFGSAAGSQATDTGHASPVQMLVNDSGILNKKGPLIPRKSQKTNMSYIYGRFDLIIRLNPHISKNVQSYFPAADLDWYTDLIMLTFILCGFGKRSRKGRGSVSVKGCFDGKKNALEYICELLNRVAAVSSGGFKNLYTVRNNQIFPVEDSTQIKRPIIQKIFIGAKLDQKQIEGYLRAIDQACHDLKDAKKKTQEQKMVTGNGSNPRFASPLIISFIDTSEGIFPLYVFVKAIFKETENYKEIDSDYSERELFIEKVKEKLKLGGIR